MKLCTKCNKNIATVFVSDPNNKSMDVQGLCIDCASKMGIPVIDQIIKQTGMSPDDLKHITDEMKHMLGDMDPDELGQNDLFSSMLGGQGAEDPLIEEKEVESEVDDENSSKPFSKKKKKKKFLDKYGTNLTLKAKKLEIDRIIGRNREIDRLVQILNRRSKNNPILIGEAGVGKTAIAEGLAVRIVEQQVPSKLFDAEIYLLDLTAVVAGTQFRGQFEGRMKSIIDEARDCGNVILVIDEVHNIVGAGEVQGGVMNASNILKPALARGEIQVIGATTIEEYRKHIEKDAALERRFQSILVEEPSVDECIEILEGVKTYYEDYHKVSISTEVIEEAVRLSSRYITDRYLPDKAIDIIDEAGSRANLKNKGLVELKALKEERTKLDEAIENASFAEHYEEAADFKSEECRLDDKIAELERTTASIEITKEDVAHIIESWTRIPVKSITEAEAEKLLKLESRLRRSVIGQERALGAISKTIRRNRSGFKKQKKPASFIFVGPTGVGKTELVRTLTKEMFGNEDAMIRVDMSEYMEKHTASK